MKYSLMYLKWSMAISLIIGLALSAIILKCQLIDAQKYIEKLESDFPEYADITSGTDEYSEWYSWE